MRIPERGEKGFTLIELLIVVAILGVLAAVVIPNVGRFIGRGETEAAEVERKNIQTAVIAMMTDNGISEFATDNLLDDPGADATSDMTAFPAPTYILYGMSVLGSDVNYVATNTTKGTYVCDTLGTITQVTTGY
ncbi:type IV pilin protein [Chloroflexota bacterium]